MAVYEDYIKEMLNELEEDGVDTRFQELPVDPTYRRKKSILRNYIPHLLNDEKYEKYRNYLFKRIEEETKAKHVPTLEDYIQQFKTEQANSLQQQAASVESTGSGAAQPTRWKMAFRDISKLDALRKEANAKQLDQIILPTTIRTRTGK